ncbi:MAG: outer membrane lipoprotein carrier protein LolA [Syntrophales bacterium]
MNRIKTGVLLLAVLGIFFAGLVWAADDFEALSKSAQNIKSISADFIQEKHLKILAKPIVSQGRLYFKAPGSIRWEYLSPVKTLTLMNKRGVMVYLLSEKKWVIDKTQSDNRGIVMDEINNWFTGRFQGNPAFTAAYSPGPPPSVILTPKEDMKNYISRIVLKLSKTTGMVEQVEIMEGQGNRSKITFKNEKLNVDLPDSLFEKP